MDGLSGLTNAYTANLYNNINNDVEKTEKLKDMLEDSKDIDDEKLMEACETFESYFLQVMYKSMRKTVDSSGSFLSKSHAEEIFQDMLDEENSKRAAESGNGIGLAQMLYKQLSRQNKAL